MKVYVYGFPGLYGGAGTELHHQILAWIQMKDIEVHLIPTDAGYKAEPLYQEMLTLGVHIHKEHDFSVIEAGAPVMGWCNSAYLTRLPEIYQRSKCTVFVGCMTWCFEMQKQRTKEGLLRHELFQNDWVRKKHEDVLRALNPDPTLSFSTFKAYFDASRFPFISDRPDQFFNLGRVSRCDTDKFAASTLHIWEYIVAPKMKKGWMLGFDNRSETKIGKPFNWITTYANQKACSQQDFYKKVDVIVQPSDTTENWPRIGFEAMASGSVLVVDDRGGWQQMVKHGETGFLCKTQQEFIYYGSKLAFEPALRKQMAQKAYQRGLELGGLEASMQSWREIFTKLAKG